MTAAADTRSSIFVGSAVLAGRFAAAGHGLAAPTG